jgi:hypothetical protein
MLGADTTPGMDETDVTQERALRPPKSPPVKGLSLNTLTYQEDSFMLRLLGKWKGSAEPVCGGEG